MQTEEGTGRELKRKACRSHWWSTFFFFFYLDGLCFTAPRTNHALRLSSFFSLFLSVRVCVGVEAWRAVGGGQRGYLWFISGHSSKKPVDAASLSCPLCPSHCFSIGLSLCRWHTGKRCPALPMLPSWSWSYSGHTHWLPAKRMNSDQPHSAVLAPPSHLALQLPVFYPFLDLSLHLASEKLHSTRLRIQHEWDYVINISTLSKKLTLHAYDSSCSTVNYFWVPHQKTHNSIAFHRKTFNKIPSISSYHTVGWS